MPQNTQIYYNTLLYLLKHNTRTSEAVANLSQQTLDASQIETIKKASEIVIGQSPKGNEDELFSIFDNLDNKSNPPNKVPQRVIGLERKDAFPDEKHQDSAVWTAGFKADIQKLNLTDSPTAAQVDTLLFVLQKWTAQIPSEAAQDIPFFEFTKLTAAATLCLQNADNQEVPFLLIGGGVSGVQDYLYDIVSKNASKNLKGRSFYIQMLSDAVLYKIIKALGLFQCNIVYASGGGFYILAPNNALIIKQLEKVKTEIANALFETHRIALYMELQSVECSGEDLKDNFGEVCKELAKKIGEEKKHKFNAQIKDNFSELFDEKGIEEGGATVRDCMTGEEIASYKDAFVLEDENPEPRKAKKQEYDENNETTKFINEKSALQIYLGRGLRKADKYYIEKQLIEDKREVDFPVDLGIKPDLRKGENDIIECVFQINNSNQFLDNQDINVVAGFQYYGGNKYPKIKEANKENSRPKTFSELGGMAETDAIYTDSDEKDFDKKFKRLGVLRMDVDGLGTIFRNGLPSLAAYSTLSSRLDWFFKGYLNTIWKDKFEGEDGFTQIIYSGGDDLFIVGRWNEIVDFAELIQREFKEYVKNDALTISAGIAIVTPKFPIMKAANQFAADAEKAAKKHPNKNAIHLFGETFSWKEEYVKVKELKDKFVKFCDANALPKTFLYKLDGFYYKAFPPKNAPENMAWHWQMAYDIARLQERIKNTEAKLFLEELKQWAISGKSNLTEQEKYCGKSFFKYLKIAVIWASYELRNIEK